jgi:hypothetical protein
MILRRFIMVLLAGSLGLGIAGADTVRLKSGASFEGTILNESDSNVTFEVERAGGTILTTETFSRDDIAELVRSTPEERTQHTMERAYANTLRYRLDPMVSYSPDTYRLVIDDVLLRFLADFPNSPHAEAVQAKLKEWMAEQGTVSSGMAKYNGVWMRAADAAQKRAETVARTGSDRNRPQSQTASPRATDKSAPVTMETATAGTSAQRDVVDQVGEFISRYWVVGIVSVVLMLWGCVHIFTRD